MIKQNIKSIVKEVDIDKYDSNDCFQERPELQNEDDLS